MALGLSRAGFRVAITAARACDEIEAVGREAPQGPIYPVMADVRSECACVALIKEVEARLGPADVLVNNAGRGMRFVSERFLSQPSRFWETDPKTWRMIIETNVNGPFFMSRAVTPGMIARGWGRIINISMNHETMRRRGFSPYGPSKAALEFETIIWAQDLAGSRNGCNSQCSASWWCESHGHDPRRSSLSTPANVDLSGDHGAAAALAHLGLRRSDQWQTLQRLPLGHKSESRRGGPQGIRSSGVGRSLERMENDWDFAIRAYLRQ
jgi:NAD(P)-dependent dehydrogenase (short-subunit alcohol dehydrogenase family)